MKLKSAPDCDYIEHVSEDGIVMSTTTMELPVPADNVKMIDRSNTGKFGYGNDSMSWVGVYKTSAYLEISCDGNLL